MKVNVADLLDNSTSAHPFHREIARSARGHGRSPFKRYYTLDEVRNGITLGTNTLVVYGRNDSCFIVGDELGEDAWAVSQFDIHRLVREIIDLTPYALSYANDEKLSDDQYETVFGDVYDDE